MATRVPVEKPVVVERPHKPIGKVHRREVVSVTGSEGKKHASIRAAFAEMIDKRAKMLENPKPGEIDVVADLFVNDVKEMPCWHSQVIGIAKSLEQDANPVMRELGESIRHHAEQVWAMRHVDDSKRSG